MVCPGFGGVGILGFLGCCPQRTLGRKGYPAEFRRRVLDLVDAGRPIADIARDLGISDQTVYNWRRQDRVDRGVEPGLSTGERAELAAARKKIRELESELAVHRRASELLKESADPRRLRPPT
ncbi:MAG: transposase [Acidimicrobiales bacterium]